MKTVLKTTRVQGNLWSLYDAIFYAETIVTTVGYGALSPLTTTGRTLTCLYAIIGIPLMFCWMAGVGELFFSHIEQFRKKIDISKKNRTLFLFAHFLATIAVGSLVFIILPAYLFTIFEEWTFVDSIYC